MRVLDWRSAGGLEELAALGATDMNLIGPLFEARSRATGSSCPR
jgi:hypothetical protein